MPNKIKNQNPHLQDHPNHKIKISGKLTNTKNKNMLLQINFQRENILSKNLKLNNKIELKVHKIEIHHL